MRSDNRNKERRWFLLLLLLPSMSLLWLPLYNSYNPTFLGMPFFYWYQMLWIIIAALLSLIIYYIGA